jgi:hypothetical protein
VPVIFRNDASDLYQGSLGAPANFGSGGFTDASSGSGDPVGPISAVVLDVPLDYASGSTLSDSVTWDNATFSSLGVTPGTYVWTWGSGPTADRRFGMMSRETSALM